MDYFGKLDFKKLFKVDKVHHDNFLFKLHHQVNFFLMLVGVVFIFGQNYLNGNAIVCMNGNAYTNQYCWLHGTGYLHKWVAQDVSGTCSMDQEEVTEKNDRETHYYLWLPFVLGVCMALVKIPRLVWKTFCERGIMASLVGDEGRIGEKIAARFNKVKRKSHWYHVGFASCELLNILMLIACFQIMNSLLNGKFWTYGADVNNYFNHLKNENLSSNPGLRKPSPMCNLFPTEVACTYCVGSIGGGCGDKSSIICILSNNLFNQYYFLIIWFWWVALLTISLLGLLYRLAQMSIPSFSKTVFLSYLTPFGLDYSYSNLSLRPSEYFLLGRLAINVKGSTMEEVLRELENLNKSKDDRNMLVTMEEE